MNEECRIPGLVLEGGAMRGMYTAGILDTFLSRGLKADCIAGVSAGALFGVNYLSGQQGRAIRYNKRFNPDPDYMGLRPLLREGNIVSTEYAYVRVPHELDPFDDKAYQASGSRFYAVITDLLTGQPRYVHIESVFRQMDVLRASGSMPLVSKAVEIGGRLYLDGAISDSIPFQWMAEQVPGRLVVILTRDLHYQKKPMPPMSSWIYRRNYPIFAEKILQRHVLYNRQTALLREWEAAGRAFVFRPSQPIRISRTERDPAKLQAVYDLGVRDALAGMDRLLEYLR